MEAVSPIKHRNTLDKAERLYLRDDVNRLFAEGKSFVSFPFRIVYVLKPQAERAQAKGKETMHQQASAAIFISVGKKRFRRANERNRIKRLVREAYRKNKHPFIEELEQRNYYLHLAFLMIGKEMPDYRVVENAVLKANSHLTTALEQCPKS